MPAKSRLDSEPRWKPEFPIGLAQRFLFQGESIKIDSQIFLEFVQVPTVFILFYFLMSNFLNKMDKDR